MEEKFSMTIENVEPLSEDSMITFSMGEESGYKELMKFCYNGEIYHKDKLIATDKELVEGLKDIVQYYRCPKCKAELNNMENKEEIK